MLEIWVPMLLLVTLGSGWYHAMRWRERAVAHARQLCARYALPLLDESVALHRLRPRWRHGRLHWLREYRFETSLHGHDRAGARMTLHGNRIVSASLPQRHADADPAAMSPASMATGVVVPMDRIRRSLH